MWGFALSMLLFACSAHGEVVRCVVDGVPSYGTAPCKDGEQPPAAPAALVGPGNDRRSICRPLRRFAAQIADGRRAGLQQDVVEAGTRGTNGELVPVVRRIYGAEVGDLDREINAIEGECLAGR